MSWQAVQIAAAVLGPLLAAAAAYGGVRAGQAALEKRVSRLETECDRAHERLDRHLEIAR